MTRSHALPRLVLGALTALALSASLLLVTTPTARADVPWDVLDTPTNAPITAADYRGSTVVFATATGEIFEGTDAGGFTEVFSAVGVQFERLALNPAGDRGVAISGNDIYVYDGVDWEAADLDDVTFDLSVPGSTYPNGFCPSSPGAPGTYAPADLHPEVQLTDIVWTGSNTAYVAAFGAESMLLGTTDSGATWSEYGRDSAGNCLFEDEGTSRAPDLDYAGGVAYYTHRDDIYTSTDGFTTATKVDTGARDNLVVDPGNPLRRLAWNPAAHYTATYFTSTGDFDDSEYLATGAGNHDATKIVRSATAVGGKFFLVGDGGMIERVSNHTKIESMPVPGHGNVSWLVVRGNGSGKLLVAGVNGKLAVSADPKAPLVDPKGKLPPKSNPPVQGGGAKIKGKNAVVNVRGKLGRPAGVTKKEGCKGKIKLTFKAAKKPGGKRKTIKKTQTKLKSNCVYKKKVKIKRKKFGSSKRLRLLVQFTGNKAMSPSRAAYAIKVKR